jgi:glycosyltransferase involved in cell wall biosynthesis
MMGMWTYNSHQLRILQISTSDRGGGAEGVALNLWQQFTELGHRSWLAVGKRMEPNPKPDIVYLDHDRFRSRWARLVLPFLKSPDYTSKTFQARFQSLLRFISEPGRVMNRRSGHEDFDFPATNRLPELLPELPDVIHCHNLHGGYFDLRALPGLSRLRPVILNLHDAWLLSGHCAHSFGCERWKTGCGSCPNLSTYPGIPRDGTAENWRIKKQIYAASRLYVTAVSQWLLDKVTHSMLHSVKTRVIYNGIQTNLFTPGSREEARRLLHLPEKARIVLFTAHNEYKDFETMRSSLESLHSPDQRELIFVCLGRSGEDQLLGEGTIRQPGNEGMLERMVAYYRAADVFIHAAHEESFGKTITEALSCATPIVATAVGGIPEQVQSGVTGFLTPRGDAKAMTQAVSKILDDTSLRDRMGRAGREDIVRRFSLERQANELLSWYAEILQDWEASRAA